MKRIVHLLYSGLGGHGSVFFSLVKADTEHQYTTEAVFCGIEEVRKDYILQCRELNVHYEAILKKRGLDIGVYFRIYRAFKRSRPATIFLHGASFIFPAVIYRFFNSRTRIIVRDTQAHHLKTKREWVWLRAAIFFADNIVLLTHESLQGIHRKIKTKRLDRKAVIIPNGLDTSLYTAQPLRDLSGGAVFGIQSRLQTIKDHPTLMRAFALLLKKMPGRRLRLRIAGDGETMESLRNLADELGIKEEVEFCGMLNEKDLLDFMHSLDIYVQATFGETMSNSIMQAMSCGLPLIASDVWGVNNMVRNGDTGILYPSRNIEKLCESMEMLVENNTLRERLSRQARIYAEEEYSLKRLFTRYADIY
ncbi:MAG TPA: glycosyltransferase [Chitinophagaceae bacterium]|nr:glycosyltransferase [Chitinophagaceae bacterium]